MDCRFVEFENAVRGKCRTINFVLTSKHLLRELIALLQHIKL